MSDQNAPKTPTITLHWLEASRAQRILFLLEELQIDYELRLYHRFNGLADQALQKIHPLGKSPLIEVDYHDGNAPKVIAESGSIIRFLIKNCDKKKVFSDLTEEDLEQVDYYMDFAEGSLQPLYLISIIHQVALKNLPFFIKPIFSWFLSKIDNAFTVPQLKKMFAFLESNLKENAESLEKDEEVYLVNNKFSGADVILIFNLALAFSSRFATTSISMSQYPIMKKYVDQVINRPAYRRANAKILEVGQGDYAINF